MGGYKARDADEQAKLQAHRTTTLLDDASVCRYTAQQALENGMIPLMVQCIAQASSIDKAARAAEIASGQTVSISEAQGLMLWLVDQFNAALEKHVGDELRFRILDEFDQIEGMLKDKQKKRLAGPHD